MSAEKQLLTETDVRSWLRDNQPELNLLIKDLEFSPEEILSAMNNTVDYWNEIPPSIISYKISNFPHKYHFLMGTCGQLLMMAANRYRRNALQYQAGGMAVNDQAKDAVYNNAGVNLWNAFREFVRFKKVEHNMSMGWARI